MLLVWDLRIKEGRFCVLKLLDLGLEFNRNGDVYKCMDIYI